MASKKYSLLAGALCLLASYSFSQKTYDVADSSVISSKNIPQYTEFMNGTYNFPAKPRNMWEIGIKVGTPNISGDVSSKWPTIGGGIHIRKALGYVFSLRGEYDYMITKGQNWVASGNFTNNPAWVNNGYTRANTPYLFYNYKTRIQHASLDGIVSLNNIRFHKATTGVNVYAFAGIAGMIYEAKVNALNASNARYSFTGISNANDWKNRKNVLDALDNLLDDTYETPAETHGLRRPKLFGQTFKPVGSVGAGIAFKLSNRINLALEDRFTFTNDDLLDGQQWAEQVTGQPVKTQNFDTYNFLSLGLNFNIGSKAVEPLWWLNPLDYAYQEIRKPRLMILPKPVLPDSDGDGVTDQFDQEVTPAGCPVDTHGVSLDTDGDGVPDCRDKEKITPTICQPVNADGIGKCPCPDKSCFPPPPPIEKQDCATALGSLPSIAFSGNSTTLSNDAKSMLASVAGRLRNNPDCRITVIGYCVSPKATQTRGVARVDAVVKYLVENEGISRDRITTMYGQPNGDCNTVDLRGE